MRTDQNVRIMTGALPASRRQHGVRTAVRHVYSRGQGVAGRQSARPAPPVVGLPARWDLREEVAWVAAGVLLLVFAAVVAVSVLVARLCVGVARRRRERLQWDDLVARHQELDRELENIWQHR
jgi:hypothetical protein